METKEQLQEKLRQLESEEKRGLIEKNYSKFKSLEGKCFKIKNCYSLPTDESDYWFLYAKILTIEKYDLYLNASQTDVLAHFHGWSFQTDKNGLISIDLNYSSYVYLLRDGNEITETEFKYAWVELQERISTAYRY